MKPPTGPPKPIQKAIFINQPKTCKSIEKHRKIEKLRRAQNSQLRRAQNYDLNGLQTGEITKHLVAMHVSD